MNGRDTSLEALRDGGQAPSSPKDTTPAAYPASPSERAPKSDDVARVMLYLHPKVARKFKEMGFVENRKAHDVYLDALDLYLARQGHGGLKGVIGR
ncbi:hypothetical protein [Enterovirga sp.]|uniref:hypothetical protein n=1 Tax=Enterovirga sp. TaxID=2026350 RepID=UPI002BD73E0E|nr:hypothetical protein [Enterovirga sp.]HMO30208.1 hypothetical protein [Enterovirga sp.]